MAEIEKLLRKRNQMMILAVISFGMWQGGQLAQNFAELLEWPDETFEVPIGLTMVLGSFGWLGAMFMMLRFGRQVKKAKAHSVLHDEFFCHQQKMSMRMGYVALVCGISTLLVADLIFVFTAEIAIRILLIIAFTAPMVKFMTMSMSMSKDDGDGE